MFGNANDRDHIHRDRYHHGHYDHDCCKNDGLYLPCVHGHAYLKLSQFPLLKFPPNVDARVYDCDCICDVCAHVLHSTQSDDDYFFPDENEHSTLLSTLLN